MADEPTFDLSRFPVHLGLGATVVPQEEFTGNPDWYERYGERNAGDGTEGRLVSMHTFDRSWDSWEMHPKGDELVVCTAGSITLHQEIDGATTTVTLGVGDAVDQPTRGVAHGRRRRHRHRLVRHRGRRHPGSASLSIA